MMRTKRAWTLVMFVLLIHGAHAGPLAGDGALCQSAIDASEQAARLPTRMLSAIGAVESGRPDPFSGAAVVWPWTSNIAGTGHFYATKAEAIAAVQAAQRSGVQSIDVGCTQINLMHHPDAFSSLEEAFDPTANARYAAAFLVRLREQTKTWGAAVAAYHSSTPELGTPYAQRVAAFWPSASAYGLPRGQASVTQRVERRPPPPTVDPYNVMTPEFRQRMQQAALFRRQRNAAMGVGVVSPSGFVLSNRSRLRPGGASLGVTLRANVGNQRSRSDARS